MTVPVTMTRTPNRSRRVRLAAVVALAAASALALSGCVRSTTAATSGGSDGSGTDLTVFISGDTNVQDLWEKSLIPAFEKKHPDIHVSTSLDLHGEHDNQTLANLTTAVKSKRTVRYDLMDAGLVQSAGRSGLLEPVTTSDVPNLADVPSATREQGGKAAIPYRASSVLLAYSSAVSDPPTTLDGLLTWIQQHPGRFAYNSPASGGSGGAFVSTVLSKYLSSSVEKQMQSGYDTSLESAWDPGFAKLASLGPDMYQKGVYPNGNDQVLQLLASGQIDMAPVWSDQFITGQQNGTIPTTVKYLQISDPSFTGSAAFLGIPATELAAKKKAAFELADFALSSAGQQDIASQIAGYPVVSLDTLPASVRQKFQDAHPDQLRLGFSSQLTNDMNSLWDQKVPGA